MVSEKNRTFIGHRLGGIHGRQALYAFVPILMFRELLPPTECFEPRNDPDQNDFRGEWIRSLGKVAYSSYLFVRSSSFSS